MNLQDKVIYFRRCDQLDRRVRRIRQRIFDIEDRGRLVQAHRIIERCKKITTRRDILRRSAAEDRRLNKHLYN